MSPFELQYFYASVRKMSEEICRPLETEDYVVQAIDDVSPPKWHLGHATWFFENVILQRFQPQYKPYHKLYNFIFNSYYESFGTRVFRTQRGALSRPTVKEIYAYRAAVDELMYRLFEAIDPKQWPEFSRLVILGLNHEQQHQELLVYDIKYIFANNPLRPVYQKARARASEASSGTFSKSECLEFTGGIVELGHQSDGFAWDNEMPAHRVLLRDYKLQNRLVTNHEYLEFINADDSHAEREETFAELSGIVGDRVCRRLQRRPASYGARTFHAKAGHLSRLEPGQFRAAAGVGFVAKN